MTVEVGVHPEGVSEGLGDSDVSITLDVYIHVGPATQSQVAQQVARLLDL